MKDYPDRMTAEQARAFGEDVLNLVSQIPSGWNQQRALLEAEGVTFKSNGHVDMQRFLWEDDSQPVESEE